METDRPSFFSDLEIGDVFRFLGESNHPQFMRQGPWVKRSELTYIKRDTPGPVFRLGSAKAPVTYLVD